MIVQCEQCQTKYRIADEKIKGKGVKVRCAKCENVFTVMPTETGIQAPSAAPAPQPRTPPTPEPPDGGLLDQGFSEPGPEQEPAPGQAGDTFEEPAGLPPLSSFDASPDPPDGQVPSETAGSDQAPDSFPSTSPGEGTGEHGAQRPAHELDQTGLFSPSPDPADLPDDGGFEIEATLRDDPVSRDGFGTQESSPLPELGQGPGLDGEWGNIPIDGQDTVDTSEAGFGLAGESGYTAPPPVPMDDPAEQAPAEHGDKAAQGTSTIPAYQPESRASGKGKKGLVALLLLAALGGGGYFAYPKVMEMLPARGQQAMGTLTPSRIQVKALSRPDGKIIYSVRGEVRNESEGSVGMVQVEAQFRSASDEVLSKARSYCGNIFEDSALATQDIKKIRSDLQNELGQSLSNANISPGQAVPFLIVLDDPPPGINKVTVTISSFKETT